MVYCYRYSLELKKEQVLNFFFKNAYCSELVLDRAWGSELREIMLIWLLEHEKFIAFTIRKPSLIVDILMLNKAFLGVNEIG